MRNGIERGRMSIVGIGALLAASLLCIAGCSDDHQTPPPVPCTPAWEQSPYLTLIDLDGVEYDVKEDLCEVPVLLDFEASWCDPCGQGVPRVQLIHETFGSRGLRVVAVDVHETDRKAIRRYFAERGATYPVLLDTLGYYAYLWNVDTVPTYVLVSREGEEVFRTVGYDEKRLDDLEAATHASLNDE